MQHPYIHNARLPATRLARCNTSGMHADWTRYSTSVYCFKLLSATIITCSSYKIGNNVVVNNHGNATAAYLINCSHQSFGDLRSFRWCQIQKLPNKVGVKNTFYRLRQLPYLVLHHSVHDDDTHPGNINNVSDQIANASSDRHLLRRTLLCDRTSIYCRSAEARSIEHQLHHSHNQSEKDATRTDEENCCTVLTLSRHF